MKIRFCICLAQIQNCTVSHFQACKITLLDFHLMLIYMYVIVKWSPAFFWHFVGAISNTRMCATLNTTMHTWVHIWVHVLRWRLSWSYDRRCRLSSPRVLEATSWLCGGHGWALWRWESVFCWWQSFLWILMDFIICLSKNEKNGMSATK